MWIKTLSYPHFRRVAVCISKSYTQMGDNIVDILRITFPKIILICNWQIFMIAKWKRKSRKLPNIRFRKVM